MLTAHRKLLLIIAIPLVIIFLFALLWDPNWFKSRVETELVDVENHKISMGDFEHSLFDPGLLKVNDIVIEGGNINGTIKSALIDLDVSQAIRKNILIHNIRIDDADLTVDMDALQSYLSSQEKSEQPARPPSTDNSLLIEQLLIEQITFNNINIRDISERKMFEIDNIRLNLQDLLLIAESEVVALKTSLPILAQLQIDAIKLPDYPSVILEVDSEILGEKIDLSDIQIKTQQSHLKLTSQLSNYQSFSDLKLSIKDSKFNFADLGHLIADLPVKKEGVLTLSGELQSKGYMDKPITLYNALEGNLDVAMVQGKIIGVDINKIVDSVKESKETSLKDIGSFLLAGPFGIIASNLFSLGDGAMNFQGNTTISEMQIKTSFDSGNMFFSDTAVATDKHRLAFTGGVNPVTQQFQNFTFAILNEQGCAGITQKLNGSMEAPSSAVSKALLDTALSPINSLIGSIKNRVSKCEPFYTGSVPHPGT